MSLTSHISECVLNRACERPPLLDGCALLLKVSRYRAHAPRGLARAPPAVCAALEASRHFLTGAATPLGFAQRNGNGTQKAQIRAQKMWKHPFFAFCVRFVPLVFCSFSRWAKPLLWEERNGSPSTHPR